MIYRLLNIGHFNPFCLSINFVIPDSLYIFLFSLWQ